MSYIGNAPTTTAFVTDQFSGNGTQTAFTMSVAPATTSSAIVAISGVLQDPSAYAVSGTTLTFSAAPPTGTGNISVRYLGIPASGVTTTAYRTVTEFTATAGQTTFSVPSYTVGYIDVYRNGVRLTASDYVASSGTSVVLNNACTVGDSVVTESFYVSSVLNAIPAVANSVLPYIGARALSNTQVPAGSVLQVVQGTYTVQQSTTSTSYVASGITASITPTSATSKILVEVSFCGVNTTSTATAYYTIYRDSTNIGTGGNSCFAATYGAAGDNSMSMRVLDSPATASSVSYTVYFKAGAGTAYTTTQGCSVIHLMEIAQ